MSEGLMLSHDWWPRPLPENVVMGERSWCHSSYAFLHCRSRRALAVRIGTDTGIYKGSFFDLGPDGSVQIGNFCTLVGAIIATNRSVVIGDYTFIAHEVVLADEPVALPCPAVPCSSGSPSVWIGENCWVGARAVLLAGTKLGDGAIVGAGAIVDFEVPPAAIVAGNPARIVGSTR